MRSKIYIRSQSLDNMSPDPTYDASSKLMPVEDKNRRQLIAYTISKVTESNNKISLGIHGITIYQRKSNFVMVLNTLDLDVGGRVSEITVYVENGYNLEDNEWMAIQKKVIEFSEANDRIVDKSALDGLLVISKLLKQKKKRNFLTVGGLLVLLLLLLVVFVLNTDGKSEKEETNNGTHWNTTQ
jgi:hypothetical protein